MGISHSSAAAFRLSKAGAFDPNPLTMKTKAASALTDVAAGTTLVTHRTEAGLGHFVVLPQDYPGVERSAFAVAHAVAARSERDEAPDLSGTRAVAVAEFDRGSTVGTNTQAGADISTVVDTVATSLQAGEWVAMSVREPSRTEARRARRWTEHRGTITHQSLERNAVVTAIWAGGHSHRNTASLIRRVAASLPGFDLRINTNRLSGVRSAAGWFTLSGAAAAGFAALHFVELPDVPEFSAPALAVTGVAALVVAALTALGRIPSRFTATRNLLSQGLVPKPPTRLGPPAKPKKATLDREGNTTPASDGDYPLHPSAFLVSALLPLAVAAPHSGAESGTSSTMSRVAPPALRDPVGPLVGANNDASVHLSAWDGWQGTMCVGQAGSGKSALLQSFWGYDALSKVVQPDIAGVAGANHTMIAFDTKGDGQSAAEYAAWSQAAGCNFVPFHFAKTTSDIGIDLFPKTGSAGDAGRRVASALRYVYGLTSIGAESFDTLERVLTAGFAVTPDITSQIDGVTAGASPFYYANILLSNRGDDLGVQLASAIIDKASREGATAYGELRDLWEASEQLIPIYGPHRTLAQRSQLLKAPRTKVAALMGAEHWWSRPQKTTWGAILSRHESVIINTGKAPNGEMADRELVDHMSSLMMYSLHEEIQRHCDGWYEAGRVVTIYADELKHIAGTSSKVISWIRNDARSFGVRAVFATQYPEQLDHDVRDAVMGFGTFVAFAQQNPTICETIVRHISVDGSSWSTADVSGLPRYEAIVRTQFRQTAQPAFTVQVPDFRSARDTNFAELQGLAR